MRITIEENLVLQRFHRKKRTHNKMIRYDVVIVDLPSVLSFKGQSFLFDPKLAKEWTSVLFTKASFCHLFTFCFWLLWTKRYELSYLSWSRHLIEKTCGLNGKNCQFCHNVGPKHILCFQNKRRRDALVKR